MAIGILSLAMLRYSSSWTSVFFASWVMVCQNSSLILLLCCHLMHCYIHPMCLIQALCWQQCGWLAHDFLHHQVFTNRSINNACGLFFGNFCQGFSVAWWKDKHNLHHAAPNEVRLNSLRGRSPYECLTEHTVIHTADSRTRCYRPRYRHTAYACMERRHAEGVSLL